MIQSVAQELIQRRNYINEPVSTVYFGGGTPSLLSAEQLRFLLDTVKENFGLKKEIELTLEANPEDLTPSYCNELLELGVNRLSLGIQTFHEETLIWMNRVHNTDQAKEAFDNARAAGFQNISLDLIYAIPDHDDKAWKKDLQSITDLNPEHISIYGLTVEEKTVFGKWEREDRLIQVPEDEAASQYLLAIEFLNTQGYIQYEVSNFGKEGFHSRHNNAYWAGVPYLGVGPGAHSFDGKSRSFNIRSNPRYLKAIQQNEPFSETETLSKIQLINEKILTQLRTRNGLNLSAINEESGEDLRKSHEAFINEMSSLDLIKLDNGFMRLRPKGFLVADEIALRLFLSE